MASPDPELRPGSLAVIRAAGSGAEAVFETFVKITADGAVTAFNGHVDLGTGIRTALAQIVAEELDVSYARVVVVLGDTSLAPNQGATIASETIQVTAVPLRKAAAQARRFLIGRAAERLELPEQDLVVEDGLIRGRDNRSVSYGELIGGEVIRLELADDVAVKAVDSYTIVGQSVPRVDLPAKATGELVYVHDVRLPGMLHGRVIRPPYAGVDAGAFVGTSLIAVDEASVHDIPGLIAVVKIRDFVGVIADREENAVKAAAQLKVTWKPTPTLPDMKDVETALRANPSTPRILIDKGDVDAAIAAAEKPMQRTYIWPYQMHGSIGPSCAVADVRQGQVRVWSGTQNPHILRADLALLLGRPDSEIDVIRMEASGCYGRNCADDVSADAVLLSRAVGGPVRVQLTREQEHAWEPKGTAQLMDVKGGLRADGSVAGYDFATRYPSNGAPTLALLLTGTIAPVPAVFEMGDRTAIPPYDYDTMRVVAHDMPPIVRASWLRGVSALPNTFAHESYIDELATEAGVDPIEYRLRYLKDPRAIDLVNAVAKRADWTPRPHWKEPVADGDIVRGRGFAYALYVHSKFPGFGAAWSAWIADVAVNKSTGDVSVTRVVAGQDSGLMINPEGVRHQIHGNVIQSTSRALMEEVSFDRNAVTSCEWGAYPIITFPDVPKIEVLMLPRQDQPPLGVGESASVPSAAAIANAIFDATGVRFREPPFTPERILAGLRGEQVETRASLPGPAPKTADPASPPASAESFRQATGRICRRRCAGYRSARHRGGRAAMAVDRADCPAGCIGLFGGDHRPWPATGRTRRLRDLPYGRERRHQCRRPSPRDAVRHHLQHQHHARCRDRHRRVVLSRLRARHARRHPSRWPASVSGVSLYAFCKDDRRRSASALCLPDGAEPGARRRSHNSARIPVQPAPTDGGLERAVPSGQRIRSRCHASRPVGIAALIWSKASAIAAPAIRRAMRSARKRPGLISPAASRKAGKRHP